MSSDFTEEAGAQDEILARKLQLLRGRLEAGEITMQQYSEARADAIEHHLSCIRNLNDEFFGEGK